MFATNLKNAALFDQPFCSTPRSSRMSFTFSIPITLSIRFVQFAFPRTGSTRSQHFWTTSSRVIGLSTVPRTSVTWSDRTVPSFKALELITRNELHFGANAKDGRVFHAGLVVRSVERSSFIHEHHGDHVLEADIGHLAIIDDACFGVG